jgi:hypothetical protein
MALCVRARADAKAARDEAVRVIERENAALSEAPCGRRPSARAGARRFVRRRDRACRSHGHRPRQGVGVVGNVPEPLEMARVALFVSLLHAGREPQSNYQIQLKLFGTIHLWDVG